MCRLLANSDLDVLLVDYDRVEPHNLVRQNFFAGDVGKFKSQALAERLARQYGRPVGYSVHPYDRDLLNTQTGLGMSINRCILIGCVDNSAARRSLSQSSHRAGGWSNDWWLDAGNGYDSGQVLIGNSREVERLEGSFDKSRHTVDHLPMPSLQLPSLLSEPSRPAPRQDCAEAVADEEQSPTINQTMATLVLEFMYRILNGKLSWMGAYVDMGVGTLTTVPAEPQTVARMFGVKVDTLMAKIENCSRGMFPAPRRR